MNQPKRNALASAKGKVTVICGPMFAGKSEELLRQIQRLQYAEVPYLIFKPEVDSRSANYIKSRDGRKIRAIVIKQATDVFTHIKKINHFPFVVAFDEAQFFDQEIVPVIQLLASLRISVIVAGLDTDFNHQPFGSMGALLAIADEVRKLTAVCVMCGLDARRTYRLNAKDPNNQQLVLIGDQEAYQARCYKCAHDQVTQFKAVKKELTKWISQLKQQFYQQRKKA